MKFCIRCGKPMEDTQKFCMACGASQEPAAPQQAQPQYQAAPQYTQPVQQAQPQYQAPPQYTQAPQYAQPLKFSDWDGGVLETFAASIVASLIMTFTCGIGTPWAICYMWKFILNHTTIDGKRLTFDGTGGSLLGNWIVWMLLSVITCGIYSFWVIPKMYKWVAEHTHFE